LCAAIKTARQYDDPQISETCLAKANFGQPEEKATRHQSHDESISQPESKKACQLKINVAGRLRDAMAGSWQTKSSS